MNRYAGFKKTPFMTLFVTSDYVHPYTGHRKQNRETAFPLAASLHARFKNGKEVWIPKARIDLSGSADEKPVSIKQT
jgi:hypothetical protein